MSYKVVWQTQEHRQAAPYAADCPDWTAVQTLMQKILSLTETVNYCRIERKP